MNTVQPIRSNDVIRQVLRAASDMGKKPYLLMTIGFNTGLRISDILRLRVCDIRAEAITLTEKKTGKRQRIEMNPVALADARRVTAECAENELLFPSPQTGRLGQPIDYTTAYLWVNRACRAAGIKGPVGCHTMRKTFGYHFYKTSGGDVALLMGRFKHANQVETLRYIGVDEERINNVAKKMRLG